MHKPGKQIVHIWRGKKKPNLCYIRFFPHPNAGSKDLPYHVSFMLCFTEALSNMLPKGSAYDKDCLKEVKR